MEVKERRPYRSLAARQDTERRYTSSSADSEDGKPNPKSYSSSETLKAFDHDSRTAYGSRVKEMVHHEVDEFNRQGRPQCYVILSHYVVDTNTVCVCIYVFIVAVLKACYQVPGALVPVLNMRILESHSVVAEVAPHSLTEVSGDWTEHAGVKNCMEDMYAFTCSFKFIQYWSL